MNHTLISRLKDKTTLDQLTHEVIDHPEMVDHLLEIIESDRGSVKYNAEKILRAVSEQKPGLLLPYFEQIAALTNSQNNFIKWGAIITLSNLFMADVDRQHETWLPEYLALIHAEDMITAGNAIGNMWKVITAYPDREKEITSHLLSVPSIVYLHKGEPSPECNRVVCGHVLDCFSRYFTVSGSQPEMLAFAGRQLNSSRPAVVKKAAAFIKRFG